MQCTYMCVRMSPKLLITSSMIWYDVDLYTWLNKLSAATVAISLLGKALELKCLIQTNLISLAI